MHSTIKQTFVFTYLTYFFSGAEGFTTEDDREMLSRIEKQLRRRFAVGSQILEHSIVQDFVKQVC